MLPVRFKLRHLLVAVTGLSIALGAVTAMRRWEGLMAVSLWAMLLSAPAIGIYCIARDSTPTTKRTPVLVRLLIIVYIVVIAVVLLSFPSGSGRVK